MMYAVIILSTAVLGLGAWCARLQIRVREEKEKRWDEISRSAGLEQELEQSEAREKCSAQAVLWYAEELTQMRGYFEQFRSEHIALQDKLSALLCPTENHVWRDGVCVKCGRVQDD